MRRESCLIKRKKLDADQRNTSHAEAATNTEIWAAGIDRVRGCGYNEASWSQAPLGPKSPLYGWGRTSLLGKLVNGRSVLDNKYY